MSSYQVSAFYNFFAIEKLQLSKLQTEVHAFGKEKQLCGLLLLAPEGINGTVAGSPESMKLFEKYLQKTLNCGQLLFKRSYAEQKPYRRWKVDIRKEIVTFDSEIIPKGKNNHLSPEDWNQVIENEDVVVLDTRNKYETDLGMFEGAVDPEIDMFTDFRDYVQSGSIPKEKKVLMYCTGGIRCEKAALEMQQAGYKEVYQLDGGILSYLERFPNKSFQGECFVFDHRVAVDQNLQPSSQYKLCPHCGDPGNKKIQCYQCNKEAVICERCSCIKGQDTCSKNCKHHFSRQTSTP